MQSVTKLRKLWISENGEHASYCNIMRKFKSLPVVVVVVARVTKNRLWQWPEMIVVTEHDGVVVVDRVHTDGACSACCALNAQTD